MLPHVTASAPESPDNRTTGVARAAADGTPRADLAAAVPQIASILGSTPDRDGVVELLARTLDTLPVSVALLGADAEFTLLYCNPIFERLPAADMLPLLGRPFAAAFPRTVQNGVMEALGNVVATGKPLHYSEFPYAGYRGSGPTLPGDVTVWNWDVYPLLDESGAVTHLISTGVDVTAPAVARHRLEQAHQRGLEAIVEVARLVAARNHMPLFCGRLSSTVAQLVGARRAFFLRLDRSGMLVAQPDAHGVPSHVVEQLRVAFDASEHGLAERIVFADEVFRGGVDAGTDLGAFRPMVDLLGVEDAMLVSWRAGDEAIGVLATLDSTQPGGFTEEDVWVLRAAAHAAGLVWQQKRAEAREAAIGARQEDMVARLHALIRVNLSLTQEADPEHLLRAVLEAARSLAGAEYAALEVLSPDGAHLEAFLHSGLSPQTIAAIGNLPTGRGVLGAVISEGRPIRLRDLADHPLSVGFPEHHPPMTTFLGVPMVYQERTIGSLYLTNKRGGGDFSEEDEAIITGLAAQASIAVEKARLYQRLVENAATDPLTGLSNRREFERVLDNVPRTRFAVLAIDVDNLKPINDEYGHEAGDAVLRAVATAMDGLRRTGDVLARVGGDEFSALLLDTDGEGAQQAAERMRVAMHGVSVGHGQARISVGCAEGHAGDNAVAVWKAADVALYRAKRHGRDRVEGVSRGAAEITVEVLERSAVADPAMWMRALDTVLTERSIGAVFQPIVRLDGGAVAGYEALARPNGSAAESSVEGLFSAAHRLGLIRDLDWLARRAAIASARMLPPGLPVFINVSAASLLDPVHGVDQMLLLLKWGRWPAGDVVLEITERETINDLVRLRYVLAAYREHGFRIALDDVGEGHSTLEVLATAMPEYVKIARSLTMSTDRPGSTAAIQAAVAFARSTGTTVVAEGVETAGAARAMRALGVELGQGWFLAPPAAAEVLAERATGEPQPR
jgi:diguanylate cyclase (GGDEF)-like protein